MKVKLIDYTANAVEKLIYTKSTRLQAEQTLEDIARWPEEKKLEHLAYMKDTIQSSWEFVNYTFAIKGVTRAFTHQLVRTRTGSYAQESQRTVDASSHEVINTIQGPERAYYNQSAKMVMRNYEELLRMDVAAQDARGLLPTNISTSIIAQFDLRTLHNSALLRLCTRTQGEYQRVFKEMRALVIEVHPWAEEWLQVHCAWYGTCAFPRYTACPIQKHTLDVDGDIRRLIAREWAATDHEATPVAKGGRTM
jgi:flavin-dependent thymidylate synthase